MYIEGVSTRKVKDITEELCDTSFSRSHISELTKKRVIFDVRVDFFLAWQLKSPV